MLTVQNVMVKNDGEKYFNVLKLLIWETFEAYHKICVSSIIKTVKVS